MLRPISSVRAALLPVEYVFVAVCAIVLLLHFYLFSNRCWGLCIRHRRACCGCRFQHRVVPTEPEILTEVMKLLCPVYHSPSIFFDLELSRHPCLSAAKNWMTLEPR